MPRIYTPSYVQLEDQDVFFLRLALHWLNFFPSEALRSAPFQPALLHESLNTRQMSHTQLVGAAYYGFLPLPSDYEAFIKFADIYNRLENHELSELFASDFKAREDDAAAEFGMTRGEMKRLLAALDTLAKSFGFTSFKSVFECSQIINNDTATPEPAGRESYMYGPLYLWHLAKNAIGRDDLVFSTFNGYVLCLKKHLDVVYGRTMLPHTLKFGGFAKTDPLQAFASNVDGLLFHVPDDVLDALATLAANRFPDHEYSYVGPPPLPLLCEMIYGVESSTPVES